MAERRIRGGVRAAVPHDSAAKHVSGEALYVDDLPEPAGMLYAAVGLSARAHAEIVRIDTSRARALPGVRAVLTGADCSVPYGILPIAHNEYPLARERVRYWGEPVAAVAGDLVTRFLDAIDRRRHGRRVIVAAVVPPSETGHRGGDARYADWGTAEDRVAIGRLLNEALRSGCAARGFGFVDSNADYADERGLLRAELSDGDVHIGRHAAGPALDALEKALRE